MVIKCDVCGADPGGRWVKPSALIFINRYVKDAEGNLRPERRCRAHVSPKREEALQAREAVLGFSLV
jgi:hypothetical protein